MPTNPSESVLSPWIISAWPTVRARTIEHFRTGAAPTPRQITIFTHRLVIAYPGTADDRAARERFVERMVPALLYHITTARGLPSPYRGMISRSRQLAVEDSLIIIDRLLDEMVVHATRQYNGRVERLQIAHPDELHGIQPEHFWEAVVTLIRSRAEELGVDSLYITLRHGDTGPRQIRAPGLAGPGSSRLTRSQITPEMIMTKLIDIFNSQTQEQLGVNFLSDLSIEAEFFNLDRRHIRVPLQQLPPGHNGFRGSAADGEIPTELKHLKGLQALSRKGGFCALKPLVVSLDIEECEARGTRSDLAGIRQADKLLRKARGLAEDLGIQPSDEHGTFGSEVFQLFVEKYPTWRVAVVDPYGHVIRNWQGVWVGLEFQLPQQPATGYEWGKTVLICYDNGNGTRTPHFYRIIPSSFGPFGVVMPGQAPTTNRNTFRAVCPECFERFPVSQRSKHLCESGLRHRCEDCHWTMFRDELATHQRVDDTHPPVTCEKCGNQFAPLCIIRHRSICKGLIPHCFVCKHVYTPEDPEEDHIACDRRLRCLNAHCKYYRKERMDEFELQHHRCYIEPKKEVDGRKGERKRNHPTEVLAVEGVDPVASDNDTRLDIVWAWDCESVAVMEEFTLNNQTRMQARQSICLIVARCLGTNDEKVFDSESHCIPQFIEWANLEATQGKGKKRLWSHNGGRYDTRLIFDWIALNQSNLLINSKSVFAGSKIFKLELAGCVFLDSCNHLSMPLKDIPGAFGLESIDIAQQLGIPALKKGEFPYAFSTSEHRDYVGVLPPIEWYEPTRRRRRNPLDPREDDEVGLRAWHAQERARVQAEMDSGGQGWNLREEELAYCRMDVLILCEGLKKWRTINLELGNCDPLASMTLASHAHNTFLTKHLQPNTIPVLKAQTTLAQSNYQQYAWADEESLARPGYKGGRVGPTCLLLELSEEQLADGWSIDMYDFRSEYPSQMWDKPYPIGDYQYEPYAAFEPLDVALDRIEHEDGMVSCEIEYPAGRTPLFHPYLHSINNGKLTFSLEESPVINRDYIYPVEGMPDSPPELEFIGPSVQPGDEWYGKVNPRHFIEHWIARLNGTCSGGEVCRVCKLFKDRANPVYTIFEVREALKLGYQLHHVYWTLSTKKVSKDLFKSFLRPNYSMKLQYSGVPKFIDWENAEHVRTFIEHHTRMGIPIQPKEGSTDYRTWFSKNAALKMCGKLMMNSQYGKFGESSRKTVTSFVDTPEAEEALLNNDGITKKIVGRAFYDNAAEYRIDTLRPTETVGHSNVILAAYVTAYGRHLLFQQLHQFGDRVLYYDTDSIVIVNPPGAVRPIEGPFLGDLEWELKHAHAFVSTGAKTYAIKRWVKANKGIYELVGKSLDELVRMDPVEREQLLLDIGEGSFRWFENEIEYEEVKQRNKGISINSNVSRILNYDLMRRMARRLALDDDDEFEAPKVEQRVFQWKRDAHEFFVYFNEKAIAPAKGSLKGVVSGNIIGEAPCQFTIMPFGWKRFAGLWQFQRSRDDPMDVT